ncbi:MAG: DoxX family protein [Bacteroidota bacterium]
MYKLFAPAYFDNRISTALLFLRIIAGAGMMFHGWKKIQNPMGWMGADSGTPAIFQALAAIAEFGGGAALIIGLLTPLAAFGIAATMVVAASKHIGKGDPFFGKGGSWELAAIYFGIAFLLMLTGAGKFSLDWLLFKRKENIELYK